MISVRYTLWNLFLAALPVALAYALIGSLRLAERFRNRPSWSVVAAVGLAWLLFVPNACYLLTEWRHFLFNPHFQAARDLSNPAEFSVFRVMRHTAFYAAYSSFGMVCFALSIRPVASWCREHRARLAAMAVPFFFLVSLGVYLGLVIRLNSWDILTRPTAVLGNSSKVFFRPQSLAMVAAFGGDAGVVLLGV